MANQRIAKIAFSLRRRFFAGLEIIGQSLREIAVLEQLAGPKQKWAVRRVDDEQVGGRQVFEQGHRNGRLEGSQAGSHARQLVRMPEKPVHGQSGPSLAELS